MTALKYFMFNEWEFQNDNALMLESILSESDFKIFNFGRENEDVYDYLKNCAIGAKKYLLREPEESVEAARRHFVR